MAKIDNKDAYRKLNPINPEAYWVLTDPVTGKTTHITLAEVNGEIIITGATTNRILSGRATWFQFFQYKTTQIVSVFNNSTYTTTSTTQTLEGSHDTLNRYDIITLKLDEDGQSASVRVIKGQYAEHPAIPTVEFSDVEIVLTTIRISKGSTTPDEVSNVLMYDELLGEPDEFVVTENSGGIGITVNNSEHPNTGTKNIKVNYALLEPTDVITMSTSNSYSVNDISSLDLYIYIGTEISGLLAPDPLDYMSIGLFSNLNRIGSEVQLKNGVYGLDTSITGVYQLISIPISDFNAGSTSGFLAAEYFLNNIVLGFVGQLGTEIFLDTFHLTSGVQPPIYANTLLGLRDILSTTYLGKEGFGLVTRGSGMVLERAALLTDLYKGSKVIVGDYSHVPDTDRTYLPWASLYIVDNVPYADVNDYITNEVTLSAPPITVGHQRTDVIVVRVNTLTNPPTKSIVVVEGVAGTIFAKPPINLLTDAELTFITLSQGETTPPDVETSIFYDEGTEATNILASAGVDLEYLISPYSGAKSVFFPKNEPLTKVELAWQLGATVPYDPKAKVSFAVFFNNPISNSLSIEVKLKEGAAERGSFNLNYKNIYNYGFNPNTKTGWSVITIPVIEFYSVGNGWGQHDVFEIKISNSSHGQLDLIFLQSGTSRPPIGGAVERTSQLTNDGQDGLNPFISSTVIDDGQMQLFKGSGSTGDGVEINDVRVGYFYSNNRWVNAIWKDTLTDQDLTNAANYQFLVDIVIGA